MWKILLLPVAALSALSFLASCKQLPRGFEEPEASIVIPAYFLHSGNKDLDSWLEEPFQVQYDEVPLPHVFNKFPLNDINYRLERLPPDAESFSVDSPGITRRQLLWALSQEYHLSMTFEYANRQPTVLVVRARPQSVMD